MQPALRAAVFVASIILVTGGVLATQSPHHATGAVRLSLYVFFPIAGGFVLFASIWFSHSFRLAIFVNGLVGLASLFAMEIWISESPSESTVYPVPLALPDLARQDRAFDTAAYPHVCGQQFGGASLTVRESELYPLAGVSFNLKYWDPVKLGYVGFERASPYFAKLMTQMAANPESGFGPIIADHFRRSGDVIQVVSDRFGFNNPDDQWDIGDTSFVAIGDSFTMGAYIAPGSSYVDILRSKLGHMLNLGCSGNGPLLELGTLIEYAPMLRPATILWFYYEGNDLTKDLRKERQSAILMRYLTVDFSQELKDQQVEIDGVIIDFLSRQLAITSSAANTAARDKVKNVAKLWSIRGLIQTGAFRPEELSLFSKILVRAADFVDNWEGEIVFVYLPSLERFGNVLKRIDADAYRNQVIRAVASVGLRVIDLTPVFSADASPEDLFGDHLNERGSRLVAETVEAALLSFTEN